jgi:enoyl-CoA hydratase/carnithine racemase
MEQIQTMPLPVITEVDGLVTAAGTQLVTGYALFITESFLILI